MELHLTLAQGHVDLCVPRGEAPGVAFGDKDTHISVPKQATSHSSARAERPSWRQGL